MDSAEEYARHWFKYEGEELDTLSECIKNIRKLLKSRIHHLSGQMRTIYPYVFKNTEVVNELRRLHNFVLVPADKASNNIVFVCKNYYYECLFYLYFWKSHLYSNQKSRLVRFTLPLLDSKMT
jgi:hypothetical protein